MTCKCGLKPMEIDLSYSCCDFQTTNGLMTPCFLPPPFFLLLSFKNIQKIPNQQLISLTKTKQKRNLYKKIKKTLVYTPFSHSSPSLCARKCVKKHWNERATLVFFFQETIDSTGGKLQLPPSHSLTEWNSEEMTVQSPCVFVLSDYF